MEHDQNTSQEAGAVPAQAQTPSHISSDRPKAMDNSTVVSIGDGCR